MLIANQKRHENIAEYLLYMFQVEDTIRAYNFDIGKIERNIISRFDQPYSVRRDIREWYSSLIIVMQAKNLTRKGHMPIIQSLIDELESFHSGLLENKQETLYRQAYSKSRLNIEALRMRSGDKHAGDITLSLNGLYGLLMLKLANKNISPDTLEAFRSISELLSILSGKFLEYEKENQ